MVTSTEIVAVTGKQSSQTMQILRKVLNETPSVVDFVIPTNSTAPTAQCVDEIGIPEWKKLNEIL